MIFIRTPTQDDTKGPASSLLVPDYGTTTVVGQWQYFILLMEGKIAGNAGYGQLWDDLTKLGQELKATLDSILQLLPEGDVCVIGILVRGMFCSDTVECLKTDLYLFLAINAIVFLSHYLALFFRALCGVLHYATQCGRDLYHA